MSTSPRVLYETPNRPRSSVGSEKQRTMARNRRRKKKRQPPQKNDAALRRRLNALERKVRANPVTNVTPRKDPYSSAAKRAEKEKNKLQKHAALVRRGGLLTKDAQAFLRFYDNPLHTSPKFNGEHIAVPFHDGTLPCVYQPAYKEGLINATVTGTDADVMIWPEGVLGGIIATADRRFYAPLDSYSSGAATTWMCGPVGSTTVAKAGCGYFNNSTITSMWNATSLTTATANNQVLLWDEPSVPWLYDGGASVAAGQSFRLVGFGISITYDGAAELASGHSEMFLSYAYPTVSRPVAAFRNSNYRKHHFSEQKTHEYVYKFNCESVEDSESDHVNVGGSYFPCRMKIQIRGVPTGSPMIIQYRGLYMLENADKSNSSVGGTDSPHTAHIKTGIVRGAANGTSALAEAAHHHAETHGIATTVADDTEAVLSGIGASKAFSAIKAFATQAESLGGSLAMPLLG